MVGLARSSFAFESWFFGWRIVNFLCYELAMRLLTQMLSKLLHWYLWLPRLSKRRFCAAKLGSYPSCRTEKVLGSTRERDVKYYDRRTTNFRHLH
jgi:hypothetical protein